MDALRYLYRLTSPFVMLAEIELSLRGLMRACASDDELRDYAELALGQYYEESALPTRLEEMSFNDYAQVIGDGRTWPHFQQAFGGTGDWQRKSTRAKLERLRDLRNDVFHFRRELDENDRAELIDLRDWMLTKAASFEGKGRMGGGNK